VKRPEGFDKPAEQPAPARRDSKAAASPRSSRPVAARTPVAERAAGQTKRPGARPSGSARPAPAKPAKPVRPAKPAKPVDPRKAAQQRAKAEAARARRDAAAELRRATKERRRYEKAEIRRFTARARARRAAIVTTLCAVGAMVVLGLVAIFSPILALRTIVVQGTGRVDPAAVQTALDDQLGTPLALIDSGRIDSDLAQFPIIQSYSTEMIPPGTMVVNIVERQPIATVQQDDGTYVFVDAAGVTVEEAADRMPGVPLVTDTSGSLPNPAFEDAVEVLLALPASLRAQVDTITARSHDDVTLTLTGAAQSVKWGSADDSDRKAELLAVLQQLHGGQAGTFDVSAIDDGIFRAG